MARALQFPSECCRCNRRSGVSRFHLEGVDPGPSATITTYRIDIPICVECEAMIAANIASYVAEHRPRWILLAFVGGGLWALVSWVGILSAFFPLRFLAMVTTGVGVAMALFLPRRAERVVRDAVADFGTGGKILVFGNKEYQARFDALNGK